MIADQMKFTGKVTIERTNAITGAKKKWVIKNLVVDVGKAWIAARMVGVPAVMSHMAVGTGIAAAAAGNSTLGNENARVALASAVAVAAKATYIGSFPAGTGTGALTEAGILNAGAAGTMLARTVFPVVNKGVDDAISITWEITAS